MPNVLHRHTSDPTPRPSIRNSTHNVCKNHRKHRRPATRTTSLAEHSQERHRPYQERSQKHSQEDLHDPRPNLHTLYHTLTRRSCTRTVTRIFQQSLAARPVATTAIYCLVLSTTATARSSSSAILRLSQVASRLHHVYKHCLCLLSHLFQFGPRDTGQRPNLRRRICFILL